jgi:hypothetical protein
MIVCVRAVRTPTIVLASTVNRTPHTCFVCTRRIAIRASLLGVADQRQ